MTRSSSKTFCRLAAAGALAAAMSASCGDKEAGAAQETVVVSGAYPSVVRHGDTYYYTMQDGHVDSIFLYATSDLRRMSESERTLVWHPGNSGMRHLYSPEIHRLDGKWYVYIDIDNGNTDNHQIYVLENESDNPMEGEWTLHGPVLTNDEWNFAIHPNVLSVGERRYLLWSGWPRRRVESETQCIYIAELENPWTLKSERVMISRPEYEWERQWINPDGSRSAYPIFVNENPEAMVSPDGKTVVVAYSASGIWTVYNTLGMLYARADADLLNPASWSKVKEPCKVLPEDSDFYGVSNISVVEGAGDEGLLMLYQIRHSDEEGIQRDRICLKPIEWPADSLPVFSR